MKPSYCPDIQNNTLLLRFFHTLIYHFSPFTHTHTHTHTQIYIYIYCVREIMVNIVRYEHNHLKKNRG